MVTTVLSWPLAGAMLSIFCCVKYVNASAAVTVAPVSATSVTSPLPALADVFTTTVTSLSVLAEMDVTSTSTSLTETILLPPPSMAVPVVTTSSDEAVQARAASPARCPSRRRARMWSNDTMVRMSRRSAGLR